MQVRNAFQEMARQQAAKGPLHHQQHQPPPPQQQQQRQQQQHRPADIPTQLLDPLTQVAILPVKVLV